jgi:hypothetical protein
MNSINGLVFITETQKTVYTVLTESLDNVPISLCFYGLNRPVYFQKRRITWNSCAEKHT